MIALDELSARALARDASLPAIEFEGHWFDWGSMRRVADRLGGLIDASGAGAGAAVAFVARSRPSALAALLGLIAKSHTIRMIYPFQSAAGIGRDVERLKPAVIVAAAEDFSDALVELLRTLGIAAIAIREMDALAIPGLERSQRAGDADIAGAAANRDSHQRHDRSAQTVRHSLRRHRTALHRREDQRRFARG